MFRRIVIHALIALLLFSTALLSPKAAWSMDRDVKSVIVAGEYGLLTGTVLGLASVPFTQGARGIFIGSSVGLYLGIVVGFYYIANRYNPDNPLKHEQRRYDPESFWPETDRQKADSRKTAIPWLTATVLQF